MGKDRDKTLPKDRDELRKIIEDLCAHNAALTLRNTELEKEHRILIEQVAMLQATLYGRKSEKQRPSPDDLAATDLLPFPDLLEARARAAAHEEENEKKKDVTVRGHTRKANARRGDFPPHLLRVVDRQELSADLLRCPCGGSMHEIGVEETQQLEKLELCYVQVNQLVKYACRSCEMMATADRPAEVLDRGILGPSAIAQIIYDRFACHMPYARLEKKWDDEGVSVSRSVMCETVLKVGRVLEPVYAALLEEIVNADLVQSDETEVLERKGKRPGGKKVSVCLWRSPEIGSAYTIFRSKSRDGPRSIIGDRGCVLQTDGASNYQKLGNGIRHAGCWAHLRRYFHRALERGDRDAELPMEMIRDVFRAEKEIAELRDDEKALLEARKEHVLPKVNAFFDWALTHHHEMLSGKSRFLPKSQIGKGLTYAYNQEQALRRFLDEAIIKDITNNASERDLRSVVLGRKNWLWFGSEEGSKVGAILMSLVHSAKSQGLNALEYLRDIIEAVSTTADTEVRSLTPLGWKSCPHARERVHARRERMRDVLTRLEAQPS